VIWRQSGGPLDLYSVVHDLDTIVLALSSRNTNRAHGRPTAHTPAPAARRPSRSPRAAVLAPLVATKVEHALPSRQPRAQHLHWHFRAAPAIQALDGDRWVVDEVLDGAA
jgi:hypothetical protein